MYVYFSETVWPMGMCLFTSRRACSSTDPATTFFFAFVKLFFLQKSNFCIYSLITQDWIALSKWNLPHRLGIISPFIKFLQFVHSELLSLQRIWCSPISSSYIQRWLYNCWTNTKMSPKKQSGQAFQIAFFNIGFDSCFRRKNYYSADSFLGEL